jgi:hypothetical protein
VNRADFESMVRRMCDEVPAEFLDGIAEVTVSPRTVPHPARADIYTLGECIPLPAEEMGPGEAVQSRIVLYHGSFLALAGTEPGFDWRREAWETLTHELRHHLEWRAREPDLEAFDDAVEQNFARHEGEPFDPAFYHDGEPAGDGIYRVEDDWFIEQVVSGVPRSVSFTWSGADYRIDIPPGAQLPAYLTVEEIPDAPLGDLVIVLQRKPGLRTLFQQRRRAFEATVRAARAG